MLSDRRLDTFRNLISDMNTFYEPIRIFSNLPDYKITEKTRWMYFKPLIYGEILPNNKIHSNICLSEDGRIIILIRKCSKLFKTLRETRIPLGKLEGIYQYALKKNFKTQEQKFAHLRQLWILETNTNKHNHHPNGKNSTGVIMMSKERHQKIHRGQ